MKLKDLGFFKTMAIATFGNHSLDLMTNTTELLISTNDLVNKETSDFIVNISSCGLIPVIAIFGITGNFISFVVFLRQGTGSRTRVFLMGLAVSDTFYLLTTFIRKFSCIVSMFDEISGHNWSQLMIPQGFIIGVTFARITSVLTMVISLERCFAVIFPLKIRTIITKLRAVKLVILIFVTVIFLMIPLTFCVTTSWSVDPVRNISVVGIKLTKFYIQNDNALDNYANVVLATMLRTTPCFVVLLCTVTVIVSLKKGQEFRKTASNFTKSNIRLDERRITVMLLALTTVYVVCLLPGSVFILVQRFIAGFNHRGTYANTFMFLSSMNTVLECINSAINFVIYYKTNRRFKAAFRKMKRTSITGVSYRDDMSILLKENVINRNAKLYAVTINIHIEGTLSPAKDLSTE